MLVGVCVLVGGWVLVGVYMWECAYENVHTGMGMCKCVCGGGGRGGASYSMWEYAGGNVAWTDLYGGIVHVGRFVGDCACGPASCMGACACGHV